MVIALDKNSINQYLSTFNLLLYLVGYALATTLFLPIVSIETIDTRLITVPFRLLCLFISLLTIYINFTPKFIITGNVLVLLLFWIFYMIKSFIVISVLDSSVVNNSIEFYISAVCMTFIPMLSVLFSCRHINFNFVFRTVLWVGFFVILISSIGHLRHPEIPGIAIGRLDGNVAFNTISFGHFCIMITLLLIHQLLYRPTLPTFRIISYTVFSLFSFTVALISGSRSPLIAFAVVLLLLLLYKVKQKFMALLFFLVCIFSVGLLFALFPNNLSQSGIFFERFAYVFEGNFSSRDFMAMDAITQFIDSPFFGGDVVLSHGLAKGSYPHNIVIESFMSLGLIGGVMFLLIIFLAVYKSVKFIKLYEKGFIAVIFLQYFIFSLFSGSIFEGDIVFVLMGIILFFPDNFLDNPNLDLMNVSKNPIDYGK